MANYGILSISLPSSLKNDSIRLVYISFKHLVDTLKGPK
jgi:hypothetical protein